MALAIVLSSCSNDDDKKKEEEFFNLKVGNTWVYKRYDVNTNGVESYRGKTDTVKVTGTEIIEGKEFFILSHTDNQFYDVQKVRVNDKGHLVGVSGHVLHPGSDKSYTTVIKVTFSETTFGTKTFSSKPTENITVENMGYSVYPYIAYYTPGEGQNSLEGIGGSVSYQPGIGLIVKHCRYLSNAAYFEYRLSSYDLK